MSRVRLSRQQKAIQDATRSVAETEEVGVTILQDLDGNRNKILDAHGKVRRHSLHGCFFESFS